MIRSTRFLLELNRQCSSHLLLKFSCTFLVPRLSLSSTHVNNPYFPQSRHDLDRCSHRNCDFHFSCSALSPGQLAILFRPARWIYLYSLSFLVCWSIRLLAGPRRWRGLSRRRSSPAGFTPAVTTRRGDRFSLRACRKFCVSACICRAGVFRGFFSLGGCQVRVSQIHCLLVEKCVCVRCGCVGAFDPSSTSRAVRSIGGVCVGGGAPAWPGAAFWWCLFREHGLASASFWFLLRA